MVKLTTGIKISLEDLEKVVKGEKIEISNDVVESLRINRKKYEDEAKKRKIYGFCTGLGALQGSKIPCGSEVEKITIREHSIGAGTYAPQAWIRAFLTARLIQLSQGHAPIRPEVVRYIIDVLNKNLQPLVPLHGSVGASGDLAPSSFVFRCAFLGEGLATIGSKVVRCNDALKILDLDPPKLDIGESLVLINNTAWSAGTLGLAILTSERLLVRSLEIAGSVLELIGFNPEHFSKELSEAKRHGTQKEISSIMNKFKPKRNSDRLQDPYSFRCIPQIYGAALEALRSARNIVEREISSSSENPTLSEKGIHHGCNFHTAYVALASENVSWALTFIMNSVYQRIHNLMNSKINKVSDFLVGNKSTVGAMILEYLVATLTAEARSASIPRTLEWLPTSLSQEDANPMTSNSILRVFKLLDILAWGIASEAAIGALITKRIGEDFKWEIDIETTNIRESLVKLRKMLTGDILIYQPQTCWGHHEIKNV